MNKFIIISDNNSGGSFNGQIIEAKDLQKAVKIADDKYDEGSCSCCGGWEYLVWKRINNKIMVYKDYCYDVCYKNGKEESHWCPEILDSEQKEIFIKLEKELG